MKGSVRRVLETTEPEQTVALGEALGRLLRDGHFVGLVGELGAGKTQFVRGVAAGAEVPSDEVASPTFAIVHPYRGAHVTLHHADLYRLSDADELYATGYFDLQSSGGAMLVEWIDSIWEAAPDDRLVIRLEAPDLHAPTLRRLEVTAEGPRSQQLLVDWLGPLMP